MACLVLLVWCLAGALFARNAYRGIKTGEVWIKSEVYSRNQQPILFWFGVGSSVLITMILFGALTSFGLILILSP